LKKEKEIHADFVVTFQTAVVVSPVLGKCLDIYRTSSHETGILSSYIVTARKMITV
jgi:hypothetical protein